MKRKLKFRIWDLKNKKFIDEDPFYSTWAVTLDGKPYNGKYDHRYDENECVVQQFTGLEDKNGVEIYEGDILFEKEWNGTEIFGEVKWISMADGKDFSGWGSYPVSLPWCSSTNCEVVGNIFENPELLK